MRKELLALVAGLAVAVCVGALLASWEAGPTTRIAGMPMQEGRASLATSPVNPPHPDL